MLLLAEPCRRHAQDRRLHRNLRLRRTWKALRRLRQKLRRGKKQPPGGRAAGACTMRNILVGAVQDAAGSQL